MPITTAPVSSGVPTGTGEARAEGRPSAADQPSAPGPAAIDAAATGATVIGVDGNSLGHRAFHSTRSEEGDEPFVTGAVVSMLASAWIHGPYDAVVVAFDHPVNRRKLDHPEYKAHRAPNHPDLAGHLDALRAHLRDCGFLVVEQEGAEADDLLAATADACTQRGWRCDLLSSDRDLTALVAPSVRLLRPGARFSDLRVEDEAEIHRRYGIPPSAYTDLAALRGDPSDGLVGARGIGPKTAARLLRDHGSVLGIFEALHHLAPKVEASLREARARIERNLLLMAPIPHLMVDVEAAVAAGVDLERLRGSLSKLGLEGPGRRLARAVTAPPVPPLPDVPPAPPEPLVAGMTRSEATVGPPSTPAEPFRRGMERTGLRAAAGARPSAPAPAFGEQDALFS